MEYGGDVRTISLEPSMYDELVAYAQLQDITVDELVVRIIRESQAPKPQEIAARTILRAHAVEQASRCASAGSSAWAITRAAEDILDYILEGR